jgi:hypothetical protein
MCPVIYATGLQRLSAFKAGAELVRCLQEAKVAAREEEEMMLEKPPVHHKQANIQGVPPEISDAVCRYCREQIGHDAYVSCGNSAVFRAPLPPATTFVHRGCFEEAKTLIIPGAEVRVDLPGDKFHGKVLATVLFSLCVCSRAPMHTQVLSLVLPSSSPPCISPLGLYPLLLSYTSSTLSPPPYCSRSSSQSSTESVWRKTRL